MLRLFCERFSPDSVLTVEGVLLSLAGLITLIGLRRRSYSLVFWLQLVCRKFHIEQQSTPTFEARSAW